MLAVAPGLGCVAAQIVSQTDITVIKLRGDGDPIPWRHEPGQLKVVAIQDRGRVQALNPEGGGVVIADILADDQVRP